MQYYNTLKTYLQVNFNIVKLPTFSPNCWKSYPLSTKATFLNCNLLPRTNMLDFETTFLNFNLLPRTYMLDFEVTDIDFGL